AEARLDGVYVVRTSLGADVASRDQAVERYKSLAAVERAFRTMKASRLEVRPIFVYGEERVRAHVFLCMLAYYVEWHMRRKLAPLLFEDDDREGARARRKSPVGKAEISESAKAKARTRRTAGGLPAHSMDTLLADLATLTLNEVSLPGQPDSRFRMTAQPTKVQKEAFRLLGIDAEKDVCIQMAG
ncbi:MAG: IS1634 family transposase, partial [Albidovulum sp.]|nr:IS1634 family transposase [Albidovulum sp.]